MLAVRWWNKSRRPEFVKQCVAQCMTCWWRARESHDTEGVRPLRIWSHKYLIRFPVILGPCVGYMAARKSVRWTRSSSTGLWRLWSDCRMRWRRIRGRKQRCTSLQVSSSIFKYLQEYLQVIEEVQSRSWTGGSDASWNWAETWTQQKLCSPQVLLLLLFQTMMSYCCWI